MAKKNQKEELANRLLGRSWESLSEREKRVIQHLGERQHISRDTNQEFDTKLTFGQRLAD